MSLGNKYDLGTAVSPSDLAAVLYVLHPQDKQASPVSAPAPLR
jgi:hypothetical protein